MRRLVLLTAAIAFFTFCPVLAGTPEEIPAEAPLPADREDPPILPPDWRPEREATTPAEEAPVPLRSRDDAAPIPVWYALPAGPAAVLEGFFAQYNREHPYVRVSGRNFGTPEALHRALLKGEELPAVGLLETSWLASLDRAGHLLDVETWMPRDLFLFNWSVKADRYLPLWKAAHVDGRLKAIPAFFTTRALIYNEEMFQEAGIKYPPATWEQFLEAARKLTDARKHRWGFSLRLEQSPRELARQFQMFAWQAGGQLFGPDGMMLADEGAVKAMSFLAGLCQSHQVCPTRPVPVEQTAMFFGDVQDFLELRARGLPLKTAGVPGATRSSRFTEFRAWNVGIFRVPDSRLPKVRDFCFWLLDFQQQRIWAERTPYLAAHVKVFDNPFYRRVRAADHADLRVFVNLLGRAHPVDTAVRVVEALDRLGRSLAEMLWGKRSAQEVLQGSRLGTLSEESSSRITD